MNTRGGHAKQQGQIGANPAAGSSQDRLLDNDASLDDQLQGSGSQEASASQLSATHAQGQDPASTSHLSDDDSDDMPVQRRHFKGKKRQQLTVDSDDEDANEADDESNHDSDSVFEDETPDTQAKPKATKNIRTARTTGRISKDKTKSIDDAQGSKIRRKRQVRQSDPDAVSDALTDDLFDNDVATLAPSLIIPRTRQELRDAGMDNLYRMSQRLGELVYSNEAAPRWDKAAYTINQVSAMPIQPGRDFRCTGVECKKFNKGYNYRPWLFTFINKAGKKHFFKPTAMNNLVEDAFANKQDAQHVGDRICDYLNRWPVPLPASLGIEPEKQTPFSPYASFWPLIGFTAFFDVKPAHDNSVVTVLPKMLGVKGPGKYTQQSVLVSLDNKRWTVKSTVYGTLQEDCEQLPFKFAIKAGVVDESVTIPATPTWFPKATADMSKVPADQKSSVQRCTDLVHWLAFRLHGCVGSKDALTGMLTILKGPFMKSRLSQKGRGLRGVYDGHGFMKWESQARDTRISIAKRISKKHPAITIRGLSRTRLAYIQEAITAKFLKGDGLAAAFKHGALVTDLLNIGRISKDSIMKSVQSCESQPHTGRPHVCQGCTAYVDCVEMIFNEGGYRLCPRCAKQGSEDNELTGKGRLIRLVRPTIGQDAKRTGMSKETCDRHIKHIEKKLNAVFNRDASA